MPRRPSELFEHLKIIDSMNPNTRKIAEPCNGAYKEKMTQMRKNQTKGGCKTGTEGNDPWEKINYHDIETGGYSCSVPINATSEIIRYLAEQKNAEERGR